MTIHSFNCISNPKGYNEKINCLQKLANTHYLIHAHGNNADLVANNGLPNVIEMTYINKKYFHDVPLLNQHPLPSIHLDYPNEIQCEDVDLNFYPFVNIDVNKERINPFLINIPDKEEYNTLDYLIIQDKLNSMNNMNIDTIIEKMYLPKNHFYSLYDFKTRIKKGITQKIIDISNNLLPDKKLYKIGDGGNNKNCIVCCTSFTNNNDNSRYIASQQILKSLKNVGFNGYLYIFNGGFPNPTGIEMKYVGVPYCFKIFMMLETEKKGFDKVLWIDAACYALNNPQPLFDFIRKNNVVVRKIEAKYNNYDAMSFRETIRLLNTITNTDIHDADYLETIVFGLNLECDVVKKLIADYYELVKLGYPFFSIFPEEIVLSSLFNKPEYKYLLSPHFDNIYIHEKNLDEFTARDIGYYFYQKDYSQYKKNYYVTFDNTGGRFGNQLFRYLTAKLFTITLGHTYVSRNDFSVDEYIIVNENNIDYYLENRNEISKKNIICQGYFQKSELFVKYRDKLMELIYQCDNNDYWIMDDKTYYIKDYIINSKHNVSLNHDDIVVSLRLDDFILYPCVTSDIIPPQYYIEILEKMNIQNQKVYIVCDTLKHDWEHKYIEFFKKWNPILIQENLNHDIALMRDCNNLIQSNSSLCWIISFLSNKTKRIIPFTPKIHMNQNQCLKKVNAADILNYVTPLLHDEVYELNVNDTKVLPLSFCVPDECIVSNIPEKKYLLAPLIPGNISTYNYDNENDYNNMYRKSRFAITKMKGGWDCLRHYEILMNGCIPLFENLKECPTFTLTTYPKELNDEACHLYNNWCENDEYIEKYNILCSKFLEHSRKHCTTTAVTKYFLKNIKNSYKMKNILLLTCHKGINYNRETLWIGLKRYIKSIGGVAVEYEKMPYLYDDFDIQQDENYKRCFTYIKRLPKDEDYNMVETEIIDKINNNFWDLIIYGKVGPDEFCDFPYYDIVKSKYNKNQIVFIFGGDEIFNMNITDKHSYHINMFDRNIYYYPYVEYLNYYKQFGTCFVRELDK
jgi:hypothetical protein